MDDMREWKIDPQKWSAWMNTLRLSIVLVWFSSLLLGYCLGKLL